MRTNISRQNIYLLVLSTLLLLFVLLFSFAVLIPSGKEYRKERIKVAQEMRELRIYQEFTDATLQQLKTIQSDNRDVLTAFDTSFSANKFVKLHSIHFRSLKLSKQKKIDEDGAKEFTVYEVNTTSSIRSPKSFYNFLDAINKANIVVGVNFPINFKRDAETIKSSFTMKVYKAQKVSQK